MKRRVSHAEALVSSNADHTPGGIRLKVSAEEEDENECIAREREAMQERGLGVIVNMKDFEVSRDEPRHLETLAHRA